MHVIWYCYRLLLIMCILPAISCKKNNDKSSNAPVVPVVKINDASLSRLAVAGVMRFIISLDTKTTVAVAVDYATLPGTASSPDDFKAVSGTAIIPENALQTEVAMQIKGDPGGKREKNLEFTVQLKNPKACTIGIAAAKGTIIRENGTSLSTDTAGYSTPLTYPGYMLVWNDEFSGTALDTTNWNQELGNMNGWGNNELEYYTNSQRNILVSNGNLIIEARREPVAGFNYSSARITTQNKKEFTFGRIDIRAKLPVDKGIWPALWMLGANIGSVSWPACGEIDIMELIGTYPARVYGTMHWKSEAGSNNSKGSEYDLGAGDFSRQFHVFSISWSANIIKWLVDDQLFLTTTKADAGAADYPFNAPQFFLFNVAVGGDWPGTPPSETAFPQRMFVDYVRVFQ